VANNIVDTTLELIHAAIAKFSGEITQVPPMYSALKFNGRPLYEYARAGINIERPARNVIIHNIGLVSYDDQLQQICFIAKVSKGTYIRTLAEDIGNELGCGASLIGLRRTQSNQFMIADAVQITELENLVNWQDVNLLPIDILCEDLTTYEINQATFIGIQNGNPARLGSVDEILINQMVRIYYCSRFLGIAEINLIDNQVWLSPKRLLQNIAGII
jgi:tRNA pseudouridine55 synthase